MSFERASGLLLHPTSLPGRFGIGDLGPRAFEWVDFLAETGQRRWQILPLGPTGYGDSPYQCFSAFAGNPLLISLDRLLEDGLLAEADLDDLPVFPADRVDFGPVIEYKYRVLGRAFERFRIGGFPALRTELEEFAERETHWLDDFALFMALKQQHTAAWDSWEAGVRARDEEALEAARREQANAIAAHRFYQFVFFRQWRALKDYANGKDIQIIGDVPIFVAYDSADVWAHPELFRLNARGQPTHVAGVPPDYFSPTGQLWGNPLYRWDVLKAQDYDWWIARLAATLSQVDYLRLDHFRGFEAFWQVKAGMPTAEEGRWVKGPGAAFFRAVRKALGGNLPIIAEDLGVITPGVVKLRNQFGLPGMKVLQFAFSADAADPFLPHNYDQNCVVYTGTHDNDTTVGWYNTADEKERDFCRRYLARDGSDIAWDFIRLAWASVAHTAIAPLQDLLGLGTEARMNLPGQASGNWSWRFTEDQLNEWVRSRLAETTRLYGRSGVETVDETRARPGHER